MRHRGFLVSAALALAFAAPPLFAQAACPDNFTVQGQLAEGQSITCQCARAQTGAGSVWGSDRYTADSSLCRAAVHAGVIGEGGGRVTAYAAGPCPKFTASSRHGVLSSEWGAFDRTFTFRQEVSCSGMEHAGSLSACPGNAVGLESRAPACALECYCPAGAATGSVWGSDLYTVDSSICAAARHAGVVAAAGGEVAVFVGGHCEAFKGSLRNGVTSADWGPYDTSFAFRYPLPSCADGAAPRR